MRDITLPDNSRAVVEFCGNRRCMVGEDRWDDGRGGSLPDDGGEQEYGGWKGKEEPLG